MYANFRNFASRLMLRWMIDEEYSSGNIFKKIILTKFDKINFQKFLAPDNDAKNKSSVGTFNYS